MGENKESGQDGVEVDGKNPIYAFNGFFMAMRSKFTKPGTSIYYYVVQWDSATSWAISEESFWAQLTLLMHKRTLCEDVFFPIWLHLG